MKIPVATIKAESCVSRETQLSAFLYNEVDDYTPTAAAAVFYQNLSIWKILFLKPFSAGITSCRNFGFT